MRVLVERPVGAPRGERPGRPPIAVVRARRRARRRAGRGGRRWPGAAASRRACSSGVDDVVGRRDDRREVADGRTVVAEGAERTDLGHGTSRDGGTAAGGSRDGSHRTIAGRSTPRPCNVRAAAEASLLRPARHSDATVGAPVLRRPVVMPDASSPGTRRRRRPSSSRRRSPLAPRALLGPARAAASRPPTARRWRPGSCSTATPGSARGSRSRSTSRTTARRSAASSGSPAAPRAGRGSAIAVDLPTQSDKTFRPLRPAAGVRPRARGRASSTATRRSRRPRSRSRSTTRPSSSSASSPSSPSGIVGSIHLPAEPEPGRAGRSSRLDPDDLPERVEAWSALDRLVWQDVDADRLSTAASCDALRGWVAGGGRLVIVGGTTGPDRRSSAFPDALLPYRPDARPTSRPRALGGSSASSRPARRTSRRWRGELDRGPGARDVGDRVVAAERPYGSGLGDAPRLRPDGRLDRRRPTAARRPLAPPPARRGRAAASALSDDSQLVERGLAAAVARPAADRRPARSCCSPTSLLIGPINYLVLERLDRREWAWVTMPVLIVVFAVGAYGFGSLLRGSDVIVNEVAIVRGAPGRDRRDRAGLPRRLLAVARHLPGQRPGRRAAVVADQRRLLRRRRHGAPSLDVLQGDPARVRDLAVGFGSLRTIRAETAGRRPADPGRPPARGRPAQGHGHERVAQRPSRSRPSSSAGPSRSSATSSPGADGDRRRRRSQSGQFGQSLSDKVVGQVFFGDASRDAGRRRGQYVRHTMVDQLTLRPECSASTEHAAGRRPGHPRLGLGRPAPESRSTARRRASSATSCTTCRPGWRSRARPRSAPTCCARRSSRPTRSSSARTR